MVDLHRFAALLGGEVRGDQIACPGPGHSPADRSLSVRFESSALLPSTSGPLPLLCTRSPPMNQERRFPY
jgi:hypothetical protein